MFMENFISYIYLVFFGGLFNLVLSRYHLLTIILRLEFLMLRGYLILIYIVGFIFMDVLVLFLYLFLVVCEGCLGLGILIRIVRSYGGEMYFILNFLQC